MNGHVSFQEHALRMDLADFLCRVASSVRGNITHGWTGFNALCTANIPEASMIGYLPVIDSPTSELATVNELLKRVSISERLQVNEIVIVLDEAIYGKAQMIRWKEE